MNDNGVKIKREAGLSHAEMHLLAAPLLITAPSILMGFLIISLRSFKTVLAFCRHGLVAFAARQEGAFSPSSLQLARYL